MILQPVILSFTFILWHCIADVKKGLVVIFGFVSTHQSLKYKAIKMAKQKIKTRKWYDVHEFVQLETTHGLTDGRVWKK